MCKLNIIFIFYIISYVCAKEIILSTGIDDWTDDQLHDQYNKFKYYKSLNLLTHASILTYNLQENGTIGVYTSENLYSAEDYQQKIKQELILYAIPCLYCDATIGNCANLNSRLENLYKNNISVFINDVIDRALKYEWDGYFVDFEPDTEVDIEALTDFLIEWSIELNKINLPLYLWIGSSTKYDMEKLFNTTNIFLVTMDTYSQDYDEYVQTLSNLQIQSNNKTKIGAGFLTDYSIDVADDISQVINWSRFVGVKILSLYASNIPPQWFEQLSHFLNF